MVEIIEQKTLSEEKQVEVKKRTCDYFVRTKKEDGSFESVGVGYNNLDKNGGQYISIVLYALGQKFKLNVFPRKDNE